MIEETDRSRAIKQWIVGPIQYGIYNSMFRGRPPAQIYDKIVSKGQKGLQQLESYLKRIAQEMMREEDPAHLVEEAWHELDAIISYFLVKAKTYTPNELHRTYLVQSLELIGFTLDQCRQVNKYFEPIAQTILSFFTDGSEKVRLAAIGGIYNLLIKYMQQGRQFFIQIFERLSILIADPSGQIRQAATFLNKALKTIVYDTVFDQAGLNLKEFVQLLAERLQTGGNLAKEFMLDWLTAIEEVPQFEISFDLPLFFRQVFQLFLSPSKSLKTKSEECLKKFLHVLRQILAVEGKLSSKLSNQSARLLLQMILVLVRENLGADVTLHALEWLEVFTKFFSLQLSKQSQQFLEPIYSNMLRDIILVVISTLGDQSDRIRKISSRINQALLLAFPLMKLNKKNIDRASQLLEGLLSQSKVTLRVEAILRWIKLFLSNNCEYLLANVSHIMELIIDKLCDRMATRSLYQLLEGSLFIQKYYDELVETFLGYLCNHDRIPMEPIFKQILTLKDAENHFLAICRKVSQQKSIIFQYHLIETLITVLVSENNLENLRIKLSSKQDNQLFVQIFINFSTNEPATLILCFLAGKYYLAKQFIDILAYEERLSCHNFRSLIRMSNLVQHSNMNHIRSDLRISQIAVKAYLSLLMALPYGKCSGLLLQRVPPQMPAFLAQTVDGQEEKLADCLLKQYIVKVQGQADVREGRT